MRNCHAKANGDRYRELSLAYQSGVPLRVPKKSKKQRREERSRAQVDKPHQVSQRLKRFALDNIHKATKAERLLLGVLREVMPRHRLEVCFQYPAAKYIVDFYIPKLRIGIEVDGEYHRFRGKEDATRTKILRSAGIRIIRFTNHEVETNVISVIHRILKFCGRAYEQAPC
jgi:very-short-patch-repair endonuclease